MRWESAQLATMIAIAALLPVAGCAQPLDEAPPSATSVGAPVPKACSDGLRTILSPASVPPEELGSLFLVFGVAQLADGNVLSSFDPDFRGAGADQEFGDPRVAQITPDGAVERLELPEVDGWALSDHTQVLIADRNGTTFLYDRDNERIVTRDVDGRWATFLDTAELNVTNYPAVSIGPDGTSYVATAGAVYRVREGRPELVVGNPDYELADWRGEDEPGLLREIAAGRTDQLPIITGFVIGADETLYLSTLRSVYSIGPDEATSILIDVTSEDSAGLGRYRLPPITLPPASPYLPPERPSMKALALDPGGRLVVEDAGGQRLLRLDADTITVSEAIISAITGTNSQTAGGDRHLFVYQDGGLACVREWPA